MRIKYLIMRAVEWQALQCPPFQALWPGDRPAPLQIRTFTSECYDAIKRRERKKRYRRKDINTEQRSSVLDKEDMGESVQAEAMLEITRMASGPQDVVSASDPRDLLVVQDDSITQLDDELQHKLSSPSAGSISPLEGPPSGGVQCLTSLSSPAKSSNARGLDSVVFTGSEHEWELFYDRDPEQRAPSLDDVHMNSADSDDPGTSVQQPEIGTCNNIELAIETPSYPTPADSNAAGCRSHLCEQLTESHGTLSSSPESLESNSGLMVAAATGLKCLSSKSVADEALAKVLLDGPSRTFGVAGTVGSCTCRARSERTGWIECKSTPQSLWTGEQDEQLLHLRDIAQLNWKNIVSYFPGMTLDAVKGRYKHLDQCRMACPVVDDEPKPGAYRCRRTTCLGVSNSRKATKECRVSSMVKARKQGFSSPAEHHIPPRHRRVTKRANNTEDVALLAAPTNGDAGHRTSRSGRPIRHPFRHRLREGYL